MLFRLLSFDGSLAFVSLDELGDVKAIHIMNMGINPTSFLQILMIPLFTKLDQTFLTDFNIHVNNLDKPFFQDIVHHFFVLQWRD